jgi:gluconokinase
LNYLIALDIGTSSTRSVAFATDGKLLHQESVAYPLESPQAGWQEQNPVLILQAVLDSLQAVLQHLPAPPLGMSISAAMHSLIAVDAAGQALTPCITWADNRSEDYARALKGTPLGKSIYKNTGTPIHPMSPLCKLAWLRDHQPDIFQQAHKFVGIKEYILFHLFGQWVVDYSIASATGLFDIQNLEWYAPALKFAGVEKERLPVPVSTSFVLNNWKSDVLEELKISNKIPIVIGASDGCLANLGALALHKGETAITLGTSAAIRMTGRAAVYDERERIFNYLLTEDLYVSGGASNNGGMVYQWFATNFLETGLSKQQAFAKIQDIASIPIGAAGLLFLPYLTGERAPVWDADAQGIFFGVSKSHTVQHFQRAVLEGVLYNVFQIGKAIEETMGEIEHLCVNGGWAEIPLLMQLLADIFGKKVHILEQEEGSAFGAFLLGMKALNLMQDFAEAKQMIGVKQVFEPDAENHAGYQQHFTIFEQLYPVFKTIDDRP